MCYLLIHRPHRLLLMTVTDSTDLQSISQSERCANTASIDRQLSNRHINLDPGGYFIIYIDAAAKTICAKHFGNVIDDRGLAVDPATGKVIPAKGKVDRQSEQLFSGRTAKELCVAIFEGDVCPVTLFDHAAYLGREFQRAEFCLLNDTEYIQD
jgi:dihydropteroate synthase